MTEISQRKIKRATFVIYLTIFLAVVQSVYGELRTTDGGHEMLSSYFFIETILLGFILIAGLNNKWTRVIIGVSTICETILFVQDRPVSPDEILMLIIFVLRLFVLSVLFGNEVSRYYKTGK